MIILDLEWNCGYDNVPIEEVLQIGAVRLDRLGGKITGAFNAFIRPSIHKKLGRPAKELPEIQSYLVSNLDFPSALAAFRQWCGADRVFASWGGEDMKILNQNCAHWKLPAFEPEEVYDFQGAFSLILGTRQHIALCGAVDYCKIPDSFVYHNALYDAVYTAAVGEWLSMDALILQGLPRSIFQLADVSFPPQPCQTVGPFPSRKAILDGKSSRRPACPVCGGKEWVQCWYTSDAVRYFAYFQCHKHGKFLCQLSLIPDEGGIWHGRLSVPVLTLNLLQELGDAVEGSAHPCKRRRRKAHWRTRRKKSPDSV